jgi:hypothetical protein
MPDTKVLLLTVVADREAERLSAADRRALEQETIQLDPQFMAVRYDPRLLDVAGIQWRDF